VVFASYAGAPAHPAWFHNLMANPEVIVELGDDTRKMRARVANGDERERIWGEQKAQWPQFADYEAKTDREIPVVILEPVT
jgi:deazaflavin-dependent oxidoreductase (nitroreductase family)